MRNLVKVLKKIIAQEDTKIQNTQDIQDIQDIQDEKLPEVTEDMLALICGLEYHTQAILKIKKQEDIWRPVYQKALFFHKRKQEKIIQEFEKKFPNVDPEAIYNEYSDKFDKWVKSVMSFGADPSHLLKVKDLL